MALFSKTLVLLLFTISHFHYSQSAGIATYWGQHAEDATLADICATGNYQFVNIAFLSMFGKMEVPSLNLGPNCDTRPESNTCKHFSTDINSCQNKGVKVFLSLGGIAGSYSLTSPDDAKNLANYIWNNFLGGQSDNRPLGDAVLDGVDFDIEQGTGDFYSDLASELKKFNSQKKVYLSAAPQCVFPDAHLDNAIKTGLFDYVWVQFYNNPDCEYSESADKLLASWTNWVTTVQSKQIFLGIPAAQDAAGSGYIPPRAVNGSGLRPDPTRKFRIRIDLKKIRSVTRSD